MRNEVAVITGAGSGLGRAMAVELTRAGVPVAGFGRRADALDETAALAGASFLPTVCDVAEPEAVAQAMARVATTLGPVSILINNAAVYPRQDILDEPIDSLLRTMAINVGGTMACTHAVLPGMVEAGRGQILNVSSFADVAPLPASAGYSVSKGAQRIFSRALVADLADRFPGISVVTWMPGALRTGMGLPDGIPPEEAAVWGVALALWREPSLNGTTFEQNRELPPPRGLKARVRDKLLFRKPVIREVPSVAVALASGSDDEAR